MSGRRRGQLDDIVSAIHFEGGSAIAHQLDVREPNAILEVRDQVLRSHGRIDGLVLAEGLNAPRRRWEGQTISTFRDIVDMNLTAVASVIDAAPPGIRQTSGVIVVISSLAGCAFVPGAGVAYSASKTALGALTRTPNQQEAEHGVRASHVCPGDVDTEFLLKRPTFPEEAARAIMLKPGDISEALGFIIDAPAHVRVDELVISPVSRR